MATDVKSGEKVAIKIYDKRKLTDTRKKCGVRREIEIHEQLDHPNIVKLYRTIDTTRYLYLVMDYLQNSLH